MPNLTLWSELLDKPFDLGTVASHSAERARLATRDLDGQRALAEESVRFPAEADLSALLRYGTTQSKTSVRGSQFRTFGTLPKVAQCFAA